ncbi:MAG: DNA (cytosine-5-)-methyltransferase [Rhodobacteraceae bacterium]|nr:MAG: DNA (cytosine-5-)-methyltransferase [Paracoccaceae bacterium]
MPKNISKYPIVDVFAGPGGLGEGFASFLDEQGNPKFESIASVEVDEFSHRTLHLRHFIRTFPEGEFPDEYYKFLKDEISLEELFALFPDSKEEADKTALKISLGPENHARVRKLINHKLVKKKKWVLVGGPPCQAYSLVGRSRMMSDPEFEKDIRHFLYREYLKIIIDHRPPVFVMENVKGLLSARVKDKLVIDMIVSDLSNPKAALGNQLNGLGYKLYSLSEDEVPGKEFDPRLFLVKAEEYGVPQCRHRMFIVGIRNDIDVRPGRLSRHTAPTVKQIIGSLPPIRSGLSRGKDDPIKWRKEIAKLARMGIKKGMNGTEYGGEIFSNIVASISCEKIPEERFSTKYPGKPRSRHEAVSGLYDPRLSVLTGHESRGHMPSDLRRYMFAAAFSQATNTSPKLSDFPEVLLPAHQNVELGRAGKMFSDRFRVQLPDRPSTTITSHISKDGHYFIHYDPVQCRSLSVREAARLQTFPDNYSFQGPRTSQYHQVGNAIPPYLARQIAEIIGEVLDAIKGGN